MVFKSVDWRFWFLTSDLQSSRESCFVVVDKCFCSTPSPSVVLVFYSAFEPYQSRAFFYVKMLRKHLKTREAFNHESKTYVNVNTHLCTRFGSALGFRCGNRLTVLLPHKGITDRLGAKQHIKPCKDFCSKC